MTSLWFIFGDDAHGKLTGAAESVLDPCWVSGFVFVISVAPETVGKQTVLMLLQILFIELKRNIKPIWSSSVLLRQVAGHCSNDQQEILLPQIDQWINRTTKLNTFKDVDLKQMSFLWAYAFSCCSDLFVYWSIAIWLMLSH